MNEALYFILGHVLLVTSVARFMRQWAEDWAAAHPDEIKAMFAGFRAQHIFTEPKSEVPE